MAVSVVSLHVYPIKGCRGTELRAADITPRGVRHDREMMLVAPDGTFLSQREEPRLASFRPHLDGTTVRVTGPDGSTLRHELCANGPRRTVRVHRSECAGVDQGDEAAEWFSTRLGRPYRLVRFPGDEIRPVNPRYAVGEVAYADDFPLLVASTESLDDLNSRLDVPLQMNRFRPNVVLSGWAEPWAEDRAGRLRLGAVEIDLVRRCGRCVVTTVDQDTGVAGREPLRTLATFRHVDEKLLFGVHGVPVVTGTVRVGDHVDVLASADTFVAV